MTKTEIKLTKPTYVGASILDLSKSFMFAFHYDKIVGRYGKKAKLLMTDTDSLVYLIETSDIYADMLEDADAYDTSDYPQNHAAYSRKNCKVCRYVCIINITAICHRKYMTLDLLRYTHMRLLIVICM